MKTEGWFMILFVVIAIVVLILLVKNEKVEKFGELPANQTLAIAQLGDDVNNLDERTSALESKLSKQEKEINKSMKEVDDATTGIQMITS